MPKQKDYTLSIHVDHKLYEINVDEDFVLYLTITMKKDFKKERISSLELLEAYIRSVHELFELEKAAEKQ